MNLPLVTTNPSSLTEWRSTPLLLPTMYDLPSEDPEEPGLPDIFHGLQPQLLDETLYLPQYADDGVFYAFDLNLYYDPEHTGWYKRPDWFFALAPRLYKGLVARSSYVMWEELVAPTVVIEFLSPGTEAEDLGPFVQNPRRRRGSKLGKPPAKFVVYEKILKIPNYIVFDNATKRLRFFRLVGDSPSETLHERYEEQVVSPNNPRLWVPELNLGLGLTLSTVRGFTNPWLRWCDASGHFFPTPAEAYQAETTAAQAETTAAQAETTAAQAEAAAAQAEAAAAIARLNAAQQESEQQQTRSILKMLTMGLAAEQVAEVLGVAVEEVRSVQKGMDDR